MATKYQLEVEMREATGTSTAKKLRRQGIIPGVIYGGGQRTYPVQLREKALADLLKSTESENLLVDLKVHGAQNPDKLVLIQAVQHEVLSGRVSHVDFQAVKEDVKIRASVPIRLTGEAIGVKAGGLLEQQLHSMEVECLPNDLPEVLEFDISHLELTQALHVGDVAMPTGSTATMNADVVIAIVVESRTTRAASAAEGGEAAA